jgi:hypothetical protein
LRQNLQPLPSVGHLCVETRREADSGQVIPRRLIFMPGRDGDVSRAIAVRVQRSSVGEWGLKFVRYYDKGRIKPYRQS